MNKYIRPLFLLTLILGALLLASLPAEGRESPEDTYPMASDTPTSIMDEPDPTQRHKASKTDTPEPYIPPSVPIRNPTRTLSPHPTPVPTIGG